MKKLWLIALLSSFIFVGCTTKSTDNLSPDERTQVMHIERKNSFGNYDYPEFKSEAEAQKLLTEKFQVELPTFYKEVQKVLDKTVVTKERIAGKPAYTIYVSETSLVFTSLYGYEQEGKTVLSANVELKYEFNRDKKMVKLESQTLLINNQSEEEAMILADEIPAIATKMAKLIKLEGVEKGLATYEKKVSDAKGNLNEQTIPIIENAKEATANKSLLKSIQVRYDEIGVARQLYCNITDITE